MNRFAAIGYTAAGSAHVRCARACEDAVYYASDAAGNVTAAALSDGAGSVSQAQTGAAVTVQAASELISSRFDILWEMPPEKRRDAVLAHLRERLFDRAKEMGCDISDLSATLLAAAMHRDGRWMTLHIGDGLIAAMTKDAGCRLVSAYTHRYLNLTSFVTSLDTRCQSYSGNGNICGFLLTSDGAEPFLRSGFGDRPSDCAEVLLQMAFLLPQARVREELQSFDRMLRRSGVQDDISCLFLTDPVQTPHVFRQTDSTTRRLLGMTREKRRCHVRQRNALLERVTAAGESGIPVGTAARLLHTHRKRYALRRLQSLIGTGLLRITNGRIILHSYGGASDETLAGN